MRLQSVEPEIALAPTGRLQAEWYKGDRHHIDVEFAEDRRVFFGLFDGQYLQEGVDSIENLAKVLLTRSSRPLRWQNR